MSEISDHRLEDIYHLMENGRDSVLWGCPVSELAQIARELQARRKADDTADLRGELADLRRRIEALEARPVGGYPYPVYYPPCQPDYTVTTGNETPITFRWNADGTKTRLT